MKIGVTVEVRCPLGSVAFQSQVDAVQESVRLSRKELSPGQTWTWRVGLVERDKIAFFAAQSQYDVTMTINGQETILEGQMTTDFGVLFARRESETLGTLPFEGDLSEVTVTNDSDKKNRIDILFGEIPEPEPDELTAEVEQPNS